MKNKFRLLGIIAVAALIAFAMTACEGPAGPMGPAGPQGPQGPGSQTGAVVLPYNTWVNAEISRSGIDNGIYFKFDVVGAEGDIVLQWNDAWDGDGTKTAKIYVEVYQYINGEYTGSSWSWTYGWSNLCTISDTTNASYYAYVHTIDLTPFPKTFAIRYYEKEKEAPLRGIALHDLYYTMDGAYFYWNQVPEATSYNIYRSATENGPYELIDTNLGYASHAYYDDTSELIEYWYKVSAVNDNGEGPLSKPYFNQFWMKSYSGSELGGVFIYWSWVDGANQYDIYCSADGVNYDYLDTWYSWWGTSYNYIPDDPGIYWYKIEAVDGSSNEVWSAPISVNYDPQAYKDSAPSLSDNVWVHGEITAKKPSYWYKFAAEETEEYLIFLNDRYGGPEMKTGHVSIACYFDDGTGPSFFNAIGDGWGSGPISFSPSWWYGCPGTVFLLVSPGSDWDDPSRYGTFAVKFEKIP